PISNVQSELLARVNPTIYDVLIAFFGGLAGVVGSIRPGKNNVIPGVAIATALMPPLCTVGYGIATGQPQFFLGALYLYIINCIFICLATLLGIKYLKLPKVTYLDEKKSVRIRKYITAIVFIMIVPATYFGYVLVNENNFNQNTERYISDNFVDKGYTMIYKKVNYKSNPHRIEIALFSQNFTQQEVDNFKNLLQYYGLTNTELIIKQDTASLSEEEWKNTIANMKSESEKVKALEAKLTSNYFGSDTSNQILGEAQAINSKITKIAIGNLSLSSVESSENSTSTQDGNTLTVIIYTTEPLTSDEKNLLITWIKSRMNNQDAVVYFPS
ncbi:MAG: DUF389 domain-containing protein, partial [Candidatus Pacebacteria bacterium]|nr:DUF389 domain-containing protein [Candidatus Paceibacterota bacterium]